MEPKKNDAGTSGELEGEGNKTADKRYRDGATGFSQTGEAMNKGLEAERDLEKNPEEYRRAEERGRAPSRGAEDLESDLSDKDSGSF
jgi:hypothetical protein